MKNVKGMASASTSNQENKEKNDFTKTKVMTKTMKIAVILN